jgi:hypothetical protein
VELLPRILIIPHLQKPTVVILEIHTGTITALTILKHHLGYLLDGQEGIPLIEIHPVFKQSNLLLPNEE